MKRSDFRPNNRNSNITKKDSDIIKKYKVKKQTIRGYYGMNNLASKEINDDKSKYEVTIRGHDVKGYMVSNKDTYEIISKHKTKEQAEKKKAQLDKKEINLITVPKVNTITIAKSLKGVQRRKVIAHEVHESELMKKGLHYKVAHKKALKYERKIN